MTLFWILFAWCIGAAFWLGYPVKAAVKFRHQYGSQAKDSDD